MQSLKRINKNNKRLLGLLLSFALFLAIVPLVVLQAAPHVSAAAPVNVSTQAALQTAINNAPNNEEQVINVTAGFSVASTVNIPANKIIRLNIPQAHTIIWDAATNNDLSNDRHWLLETNIRQGSPVFEIAENGTLSIDGGGQVRSHGVWVGTVGNRTKYITRTAIINSGTLNIIDAIIAAGMSDNGDYMVDAEGGAGLGSRASANSTAVGVRNQTSGTINFYKGRVQARSGSFGWSTSSRGYATSLSVGILNDKGGSVNMFGGTILVRSKAGGGRPTQLSAGSANYDSHAIGIMNGLNGKATISGGSIDAEHIARARDNAGGTYYGSAIGVSYQNENYPNIYDLEVSTKFNNAGDNVNFQRSEVAVGPEPTGLSQSSGDTGAFKDEGGNLIATDGAGSLTGGMLLGRVKVAVYYRFWNSVNKTGTPQVFRTNDPGLAPMLSDRNTNDFLKLGDLATTNPNPGTSTTEAQPYPYGDGAANKGFLSPGRYFGYNAGGMPSNTDFYYLHSLSYSSIPTAQAPNHYNPTYATMAEFVRGNTDPQVNLHRNQGVMAINGQKAFVYVDYVMQDTHKLRVSLSPDPSVQLSTWTMTYQNRATVAGTGTGSYDIPIYIFNTYSVPHTNTERPHKDITDAYNLNPADTHGHLSVTYKHKLSTQGEEAYVDGLPMSANAAGQEYNVRVYVPSDTTYSPNAKNVAAPISGYFEFTLKIERAVVQLTPNEPFTSNPVYGTRLDALDLANEITRASAHQHVTGSYSWALGGNHVPNVVTEGDGIFETELTFTPSAAFIANYAPATFNVKIKILPRPLTIYAGTEASTTIRTIYGNWPVYTAHFSGLAPIDLLEDGQTPKPGILSDLDFEIKVDGIYTTYKPVEGDPTVRPDLAAGTYPCKIDGFDNANYLPTYDEDGELEIGKRTLTLAVKAPETKHFDGTFDVDVELTNPRGNTSWDNVGVSGSYAIIYPATIVGVMEDYLVSDGQPVRISIPSGNIPDLIGPAAANYNVALDGLESLTTIIIKALATYEIPEFTESFVYDAANVLSNADGTSFKLPVISGEEGYDNGRWEWDESVVDFAPEVGNTGYKAWFIPEDLGNFDPSAEFIEIPITKKEVDVTIVLRNPLQETFYGDDVPGFAFKFNGFTGADEEDNVTMTGNYTMSCAYQKGSNAGTYPITVTLNNLTSRNYNYTAVDSELLVKKRPVYVKPNSISKEYGYFLSEGDFTAQITNMVEGDGEALLGDLSYMTGYHHNNLATRGVGDYVLNVTASGNPQNYEVVPQTGILTITKGELRFTAGNIPSLDYGQPTPDLSNTYTVTGYKFNESPEEAFTGSPLISTPYIQGNPVDTYDITISRNDLASDNYNIIIEARHGYLIVVPATPTVTAWPTAEIEHSRPLEFATIDTTNADASVLGTYAFRQPDHIADYINDNDASVTHEIVFYPTDTNYSSVTGFISITVLQKEIEGTVGISGAPILGETLTVDLSAMNPTSNAAYIIEWFDSSAQDTALHVGDSFALDASSVGKRILVKITGKEAYTGVKISSQTSVIIDAAGLQDVESFLFNIAFDFDGDYEYTGTSKPVNVVKDPEYSSGMGASLTVKYNNSTTAPRDAGTYRVTVDISAGSVYKPASGFYVGEFTIKKAPLVASYSPLDKTYDGTKKATAGSALTFEGRYGNDDVEINSINASYEFESADVSEHLVHVAVKNAFVEGAQAHNYYIDDTGNFARIEKRQLQVIAQPVKRVYEPDNYFVDVNFQPNYTGLLGADRDKVLVEQGQGRLPSNDNGAGFKPILEISAVLSGEKGHNYSLAVSNLSGLTVEIERATPDYGELPVIAPIVYNYDRPLSSVRISDTSHNWSWINPNTIPQVINEGYPARYTPSSSQINNYRTLDLVIPLTVERKEVKIYASVIDVVRYGDPEPRVNISYRGISPNENENEVIKGGPATYITEYNQYDPVGGDYSIYVDETSVFADNYYFTYDSANPAKIIVNPATLTVTATPISRPYSPGNTSVDLAFGPLNGILRNDNVALASTTTTGNVVDPSAGDNKTITSFTQPSLTGLDAGNYNVQVTNQGNLRVDITKAIPEGHIFPSRATVEFGRTLAYAQFEGGSTGDLGGYFYYEERETSLDIGNYSDYIVVYQPGDVANYQQVRQTISLDVVAAYKYFNLTVMGEMIVGTTLRAAVSGLTPAEEEYLMYRWYRKDISGGDPQEVLAGANATEYELTEDDIGYQIILTVDLGSPYDGGRTFEGTRLVTEEILTFWQKFMKWWYDLISALQAIFSKISF